MKKLIIGTVIIFLSLVPSLMKFQVKTFAFVAAIFLLRLVGVIFAGYGVGYTVGESKKGKSIT